MCRIDLQWDALVTLILYIVGVPLLLMQSATLSVRRIFGAEAWYRRKVVLALSVFSILLVIGGILLFCWRSTIVLILLILLAVVSSTMGLLLAHFRAILLLLQNLTPRAFKDGKEKELRRYLAYLELLGEEAKSDEYKLAVIETLGTIAKKCSRYQRNDGNALRHNILALKYVLLKSSEPPSASAFIAAIKEFEEMLKFSKNSNKFRQGRDAVEIAKALAEIGRKAVETYPNSGLGTYVLDVLKEHPWLGAHGTNAIVKVASEAINMGQLERVGVAALRSVQELIAGSDNNRWSHKMLYDYIGIIALMCSKCGFTGKNFAAEAWMEFCAEKTGEECDKYVQDAYDHYAQFWHFRLADAIQESKGGSLGLCAD